MNNKPIILVREKQSFTADIFLFFNHNHLTFHLQNQPSNHQLPFEEGEKNVLCYIPTLNFCPLHSQGISSQNSECYGYASQAEQCCELCCKATTFILTFPQQGVNVA